MKTWRCTTRMRAWEGDTGQVFVTPGPLRPTAGVEHISREMVFPIALSFTSQLLLAVPMESQRVLEH